MEVDNDNINENFLQDIANLPGPEINTNLEPLTLYVYSGSMVSGDFGVEFKHRIEQLSQSQHPSVNKEKYKYDLVNQVVNMDPIIQYELNNFAVSFEDAQTNFSDIIPPDPNYAESGTTLLHLAVHRQHTVAIKHLLLYGADVNAQDSLGRTPLHIACSYPNTVWSLQTTLQSAGVNVDEEDIEMIAETLPNEGDLNNIYYSDHPLVDEYPDILNELLALDMVEYGGVPTLFNPEITDEGGNTIIHLLATWNRFTSLQLFLKYLYEVHNPRRFGNETNEQLEKGRQFISHLINYREKTSGATPLYGAVFAVPYAINQEKLVSYLAEFEKAKVKVLQNAGMGSGNITVLSPKSLKDITQFTFIMKIYEESANKIRSFLIQVLITNLNLETTQLITQLTSELDVIFPRYYVSVEKLEIANRVQTYLIKMGADPNMGLLTTKVDKNGNSYILTIANPLITAISENNIFSTINLVKNGADVNIVFQDYESRTGVSRYIEREKKYVVSGGNKINVETPLLLAIKKRSLFLVKFLTENGADLNVTNMQGQTAIDSVRSMLQQDSNNRTLLRILNVLTARDTITVKQMAALGNIYLTNRSQSESNLLVGDTREGVGASIRGFLGANPGRSTSVGVGSIHRGRTPTYQHDDEIDFEDARVQEDYSDEVSDMDEDPPSFGGRKTKTNPPKSKLKLKITKRGKMRKIKGTRKK
tara:strand:+ start:1200 stop:3308 length:2109 start_codon:yes stop_codon:yes gene_type:complete